jgi:hypothetical protein
MASLHPLNVFLHFTGRLSINILVLVVVLLLDGEDFLMCEEDVFMPVLSVLLEKMHCSCLLDLLQSGSMEVPLQAAVRSHV